MAEELELPDVIPYVLIPGWLDREKPSGTVLALCMHSYALVCPAVVRSGTLMCAVTNIPFG